MCPSRPLMTMGEPRQIQKNIQSMIQMRQDVGPTLKICKYYGPVARLIDVVCESGNRKATFILSLWAGVL